MNSAFYPSIGIVIPTKNAGVEFRPFLTRLCVQDYPGPVDMLVIDSGSTDGTGLMAEEFGFRVKRIDPATFNHGQTRNQGIAEVRGDLVLLLTQDAIPAENDFLRRMVEALRAADAAGVYARQAPYPEASELVRRNGLQWVSGVAESRRQRIESINAFLALSPAQQHLQCVFENVASLIRRDVWEKIPFPQVAFGEDLEWGFRALCNGYTLAYAADAVVWHSHERDAGYTYKRTLIDHYRLYELFGLRTIPSLQKVARSVLLTTARDWGYLLLHFRLCRRWGQEFWRVPYHAWASAWGQYQGAKTAASGLSITKVQGV
ncbi:MAG: glycosyltransferase [bacterium]|jgi:rhamnosyltransferase|nr:glycosyltransferase [bacterium]